MMSIEDTIPKRYKFASSVDWGKTVVLFITTHGQIIKQPGEGQLLETFVVPEGITVKRALVSTPGECNIVFQKIVNSYSSLVSRFIRELKSDHSMVQNQAIEIVLDAIKKFDTKLIAEKEETISDLSKQEKEGTISEEDAVMLQDYKTYIQQFDKAFKFNIFDSGQPMLNKKYSRENPTATRNDWVIKVMGVAGDLDLLEYVKTQTRRGESFITLEHIVNYLKEKNAETIILFDLSCSNIVSSTGEELDQREVRMLRRSMYDSGNNLVIGGKTRKQKRYKKYKKNKKNKKRSRKTRK